MMKDLKRHKMFGRALLNMVNNMGRHKMFIRALFNRRCSEQIDEDIDCLSGGECKGDSTLSHEDWPNPTKP